MTLRLCLQDDSGCSFGLNWSVRLPSELDVGALLDSLLRDGWVEGRRVGTMRTLRKETREVCVTDASEVMRIRVHYSVAPDDRRFVAEAALVEVEQRLDELHR